MKYIIDHIPKTSKKRPGYKLVPEYLTIHSTGNPKSTARNERDYLTNPQNTSATGWHICIDEAMAIEAIPLNEVAWHAGDGDGKGNRASIGIELAESGNRKQMLVNAATLIAKMLHERGWGVDRLKRHYDWIGKLCPNIFYDKGTWKGWADFKALVANEISKLTNKGEEEVRYNKVEELPDWAKPTIQKLINKGHLRGDGQGLDLSGDMLRVFVIHDRMGLYDG